jgi:hypothetical protein
MTCSSIRMPRSPPRSGWVATPGIRSRSHPGRSTAGCSRRGSCARSTTPVVAYAEGGAAGSRRRNAEIAQALGRSATQMRDDVYAARRDGLLKEGPGRGRAGGSLTAKGRAIVRELEQDR